MVLKWPFISDTREKTFIIQVSQKTELFKSVEVYLEDGFKMAVDYMLII